MPVPSILSRIRGAHPDHRVIARGLLAGTIFVALSKLVGAAKEMAIAWRYGVSGTVDTYLYVFNLVNWPVAVWFGVLGVVLVPLAATIRERSPQDLAQFRAELLGLSLVIGLVLVLIAQITFPHFLPSSLSGLEGSVVPQAQRVASILSWMILFSMPISLLSVWTTAAGRYTNTLQEGLPALTILVFVVLSARPTAGVLVWGTIAGVIIHLIALCVSQMRHDELERPRFALKSAQWGAFSRGFGIMLAGQAVLSLGTIIDQLFAARLGTGSIATLGYANRITALILGLGATAVSRASLPVFSEGAAKGLSHVQGLAFRWAKLLFAAGVVAVAIGWWLAPSLVALLFERGAFTSRDTARVAEIFRFSLFQVPLFFSSLVLVSLVSSQHNYMALLYAGIIGVVVKFVGNVLLVPWMALNGLVLVNGLVYGATAVFLYLTVRGRN